MQPRDIGYLFGKANSDSSGVLTYNQVSYCYKLLYSKEADDLLVSFSVVVFCFIQFKKVFLNKYFSIIEKKF